LNRKVGTAEVPHRWAHGKIAKHRIAAQQAGRASAISSDVLKTFGTPASDPGGEQSACRGRVPSLCAGTRSMARAASSANRSDFYPGGVDMKGPPPTGTWLGFFFYNLFSYITCRRAFGGRGVIAARRADGAKSILRGRRQARFDSDWRPRLPRQAAWSKTPPPSPLGRAPKRAAHRGWAGRTQQPTA